MKERIEYIDSIKGFAILLMVMGHVISWIFEDWHVVENEPSPSYLWLFIYKFHMPVFIFVSGLLAVKKDVYNCRAFMRDLWKKGTTLLLPYLIVGPLLRCSRGEGVWFDYWFLLVLFECLVINYLWELIRPSGKYKLLADVAFYLLLWNVLRKINTLAGGSLMSNFFELDYLQYMYFFFSLGNLCSRYKWIEFIKTNNHLFTFCICYYMVFFFGREARIVPPVFWLLQIARTSMCFALVYLFHNVFTEGKLIQTLKYVGQMSLQVYLIHFFFEFKCIPMGDLAFDLVKQGGVGILTNMTIQIVYAFAVSFVVICLSLFVARIIGASDILSRLLLGRKSIR